MLLVWSIPTIVTRPTTVVELSVFYLMIISYFFVAWIWPAKSLLHGLNETKTVRTKNSRGLTWIASALLHSLILSGILVSVNTEPIFLFLTLCLLFTVQLVVWLAYCDACSSENHLLEAPNETNAEVQPQQVIEIESENLERIRTRNQGRMRTERTGGQEDRETGGLTLPSLIVDIPDGATHQDLPPTYHEAVSSQMIVEKDCRPDHGDDGDGDQDTGQDQPPRYSQLNLHLT